MISIPDGVEVVASVDDVSPPASPPLLVVDRVTAYLDAEGIGEGRLSWSRIGDGQSNVTYLIERGETRVVLRRGPRPPLPRSTHDMVREARIQRLVADAGIPVPRIISICDDPAVLGVPFYVMQHLDGVVVTDTVPSAFDSAQSRRAVSYAAVDTLAALHEVDVTRGPIADFGRPEGYLARQVERFASLWELHATRELPDVHRLAGWLAAHLPTAQRPGVVHGDYRLGNLMLHPATPPRVMAVLDWEMATLGDPLADLGYLTATYAQAGEAGSVMELTSATREPGFATRDELVERYASRSTLDLSGLGWYQVLALWKAAIFCEAIRRRWLNGERPGDEFGPRLERGVPELLSRATGIAEGG